MKDTIKTKLKFVAFIQALSSLYGVENVNYFFCVERFKDGQFTHIHAIIWVSKELPYNDVSGLWRSMYGRCKIEAYQKDKGANYYLTKYLVKELCDWDIKIKKEREEKLC